MAGRAKADQPKRRPGWLNKKDMAASIGISVQAFDKWGIEPVAKIGRETFFTVDAVIDYCIARELKKFEKSEAASGADLESRLSDENLSLKERAEILRVAKLELENQRLKLQNAVLEGRSLPSWGVTEVLSRILSRTGEIYDGLALKIKRKHPKLDKRVVELIRVETVKAQNEVARIGDYVEEIIDAVVAEAEEGVH